MEPVRWSSRANLFNCRPLWYNQFTNVILNWPGVVDLGISFRAKARQRTDENETMTEQIFFILDITDQSHSKQNEKIVRIRPDAFTSFHKNRISRILHFSDPSPDVNWRLLIPISRLGQHPSSAHVLHVRRSGEGRNVSRCLQLGGRGGMGVGALSRTERRLPLPKFFFGWILFWFFFRCFWRQMASKTSVLMTFALEKAQDSFVQVGK